MVKIVRVFLALFATLWYTTSPINSGSTSKIWVMPSTKVEPALDLTTNYYKPLDFNRVKFTPADAECLAKNIYFEAGVESTAGKLAVANVTINRAIDSNYPNTICGVVQEGIHYYNSKKDKYFPVRDRCQFSWYCDGLKDEPREGRTWDSAQELAERVLVNHYDKALIDLSLIHI